MFSDGSLMENCCESSPCRGDLFGFLCDGLVIDILSRIPTQKLAECSAVCKRWHSLLGTPFFVQEHERRPASSSVPLSQGFQEEEEGEEEASNQLLFLTDEETRRRSRRCTLFRFVRTEKKRSWPLFRLRASYHGLLLFQEDPSNPTHCILNPLTREVVTFTSPDQVCGLYYHPPNMQYRLLCVRKVTADTGTSSFLYYVRSTSREFIKEVGTHDFEIDVEEAAVEHHRTKKFTSVFYTSVLAVAADSYLYWPVYQKPPVSGSHIITFDVMSETLHVMPHPKGQPFSTERLTTFQDLSLLLQQHRTTRLFEVGNRLHLHVTGELGTEVWALEDHKTGRWAKVFALDGMNFRDDREEAWNRRLPLTVEDGELLYAVPQGGVFLTNSLTKQAEFIGNMRNYSRFFPTCTVNWRKSLVSFTDYL